jgi:para-aminobenzoate synthetase component 1
MTFCDFPDFSFFFSTQKKVFVLKGNKLEIQYLNFVDDEIDHDYATILFTEGPVNTIVETVYVQQIFKKYLKKVIKVKDHIHRGDI